VLQTPDPQSRAWGEASRFGVANQGFWRLHTEHSYL